MSDFKIHYLGVGSATPSMRHLPSCQVIDFRGKLYMIDCGEGAQLSMRRMGLKFSRLEHIFISHLHGDHFFGLPGLLSTLALHDKGGKLIVHLPEQGVKWLKETMDMFCRERPYELEIKVIPPEGGILLEEKALTIEAFPLQHRVACTGFIFREAQKPRHLRGDMVKWLQIPVAQLKAIKEGADYTTPDGKVYSNEMLTTEADRAASYAYCSDTVYMPELHKRLAGIDVIYHEATYLDTEKEKAKARFHSTAAEATRVAAAAGAKRLVLGHYSKAYPGLSGHIEEAEKEALKLGAELMEITAADEDMTINL
ncbi:MAG: ribonuclease Z [Muribaculaceae bacterium]|nr:ribonuclease Z [Muribaculaceae bacterium]